MSDNFAARLGDEIIHASMLADIASVVFEGVTYVAAGAIVAGVAVAAAPVLAGAGLTTAAAAATAVGGSCVVSGMIAGFMASALGLRDDIHEGCEELARTLFPPSPAGVIATGAQNVLTNDLPAARAAGRLATEQETAVRPQAEESRDFFSMLLETGRALLTEMWDPTVDAPASAVVPSDVDKVLCEKHPPQPEQYLAEGSSSVSINDLPAVRGQDRTTCGANVSTVVSPNVIIGGETVVVRPIKSGKLPGMEVVIMAAGLLTGRPGRMLKNLPCMLMMAGGGMLTSWATEEVSRLGSAVWALGFPVHAATGAKVLAGEEDLDFSLPARFPLIWQRIYNSRNLHGGMFGQGWRTEFDTFVTREGALCCFHDAGGRELRFDTPAPGTRRYYADEGLIIAGGQQGQMAIADADGSVWRLYLPDSPGSDRLRLASLCDEYGNGLLTDYDRHGRLAAIRDTEGALDVRLNYDDIRHPTRVTQIAEQCADGPRVLVRYARDEAGRLTEVRDAEGRVRRRFSWTAEHLMASHQMPEGLRCDYRWTLLDTWRVTGHSTSAGAEASLHYDLDARLTTVTDGLGHTRIHAWNADFLPVRFTDEAGGDWHYVWDSRGLLTEHRNPDGHVWRYRYDDAGNLTEEEDAAGQVTLTSWLESRALPVCVRLPEGGVYRYGYDACHGLTETVFPGGERQFLTRDGYGQVTAVADSDGVLQRADYNRHGQTVSVTDCSGNVTRYAYSERHWLREVLDAAGYLLAVSGPEGWREQMSYDACGRLICHRLADGREVQYRWDAAGWLCARRDPRGGETLRQRDSRFRLTGLGNENGEWWRFTFGANDRLMQEQAPDGSVTRYSHDRCDRAVSRTFLTDTADALTWRMAYSATGQLTGLVTPDISRTYRHTPEGRLSEVAEQHPDGTSSRVTLAYDAHGRLLGETGAQGTVGYAYDLRGNRTVTQLPDGRQLRRQYYGSGHLLHLALDGQEVTAFTRDALHREVSRTQGSLLSRRRYDRLGRLSATAVCHESAPLHPVREVCREYDLRHNLVREQERVKSPWPWTAYGYDEADNLLIVRTDSGRLEHFRCDPAGNPLAQGETVCRYNRPAEVNGVRYRYDAHGRVSERRLYHEEQTLEYDTLHRLVRVTCRPAAWDTPERHIRYEYDGLNRRTKKQVRHVPRPGYAGGRERTQETHFLWEGLRLLAEETAGRPVVYLYEDSGSYVPLARAEGRGEQTRLRWYHCQVNGAPEALTDEAGHRVWRLRKAGWGAAVAESGETEDNLRYQGQYLDRETGLHYNLFRYYDPESGRFTQPDPIGLAGGINLYQYAPNPLGWSDPLGLLRCNSASGQLPPLRGKSVSLIGRILNKFGFTRTNPNNTINQKWKHADGSEVQIHPYGDQQQKPWKTANNGHVHKYDPSGGKLDDRGTPSISMGKETHIGIKNPADLPTVRGRPHGSGAQ